METTSRHLFGGSRALLLAAAAAWLLFFCAPPAHGGLVIISAPSSVELGALQSQNDAYAFYESTVTLAEALPVDLAAPGLYNSSNPDSPGVIPALTTVNSYMLHHESVDKDLSGVIVVGVFPQPILGIIMSDTRLDATDGLLGNGATTYPTGLAYRALEIPFCIVPDAVFWGGNQVFLSVKTNTAEVLDQIRIITLVPEPASLGLAIAAAPMVLLLRRRWRGKG